MSSQSERGFTMAELMIVIVIIAIMAVISVRGFQDYQRYVVFEQNVVHAELNLREAQVNASAVRELSGEHDGIYGVFFDEGLQQIILYGNDSSGLSYIPGDSEIIQTYSMNQATYSLKAKNFVGPLEDVVELSVAFERPFLSANIIGDSLGTSDAARYAQIEITSADGFLSNTVCVFDSGLIEIVDGNCE